MPHSMALEEPGVALRALNVQKELRSFLVKVVLPKVAKYFFGLLDLPREALHERDVSRTFAWGFTSTTCGHAFWNRCHVDDDAWVTILVATGACRHGGGFVHPTCGVVQAVRAGDMFIVNPCIPHSTCEFGDVENTRRMIALFVSSNALRACMTSAVVQSRM